jgi:hypothetical protein
VNNQEIKLVEPTTQQREEFPKFRQKWMDIGTDTSPMNREETYDAVMQCYDCAREELERPDFIIFVKSPFQLYYVKPIWNFLVDYFQGFEEGLYTDEEMPEYEPALWYSVKVEDEYYHKLRLKAVADIFDEIIKATKDKVPDLNFRGDERAYRRAFGSAQRYIIADYDNQIERFRTQAQKELGAEIYGQNETWLCFFEFMEWAGATGLDGTMGLRNMAHNAGWWIPYDTIAVVSDRPCSLHIDDEGNLHSHDSPAIEFRDGWKYYASHGVELPAWVIETPELIDAEKIDLEDNVEVRRVMIELYGLDKYLSVTNAELVDKDDNPHIGTLWRKPQEDDEDIYMLEVRNSTPEADGTWKTYVLRVPPTMETALQANAWTFNCDPEEYTPVLQS